jgi:outer membrane protein assembly factor BamB
MSIRSAGFVTVVCFAVTVAHAASPVYFRHDDGVANVNETPLRFDASKLLWRVAVPHGHSTPIIVGDAVYLTAYDKNSNTHSTIAIDRATGQQIWQGIAPTDRVEPQHQIGSPASATVASDGERVYAFFGSIGVLCYSVDGELLWSKNMGPFQDEYGSSSSPILVGDRLILNEDHDTDNFLTAIDKVTGQTTWRVSRDEFTRSYATPTIWEHNGRKEIIVAGSTQLAACM